MQRHDIFLEYNHEPDIAAVRSIGATGVMAPLEHLTEPRLEAIRRQKLRLGVVVTAFEAQACPLSIESQNYLTRKVDAAIALRPDTIWLDRFCFGGHWEMDKSVLPSIHGPCNDCSGKDRATELTAMAERIGTDTSMRTLLGYLTVPLRPEHAHRSGPLLGEDHAQLGEKFDLVAPTLYHRALCAPLEYIGTTISRLAAVSSAAILPVIQVKDMPGNDRMSDMEIWSAYQQANHPRAEGVAWFSWDHAVEKNKMRIIANCIASA